MIDDKLLIKSEKNTSYNDDIVKQTVRYLHISDMPEEYIALHLDLEITLVKDILKELSLSDKPESINESREMRGKRRETHVFL